MVYREAKPRPLPVDQRGQHFDAPLSGLCLERHVMMFGNLIEKFAPEQICIFPRKTVDNTMIKL